MSDILWKKVCLSRNVRDAFAATQRCHAGWVARCRDLRPQAIWSFAWAYHSQSHVRCVPPIREACCFWFCEPWPRQLWEIVGKCKAIFHCLEIRPHLPCQFAQTCRTRLHPRHSLPWWFWNLQRESQCAVSTLDLKTCLAAWFVGSRHYAPAFVLQVSNSCTDLDPTLLSFLILRTYVKFVHKNKMLALGVCFPQPCSSDGRRFAASRSRLNYHRTIGWFPQEQIRWNAL